MSEEEKNNETEKSGTEKSDGSTVDAAAYWKRNLQTLGGLLAVWFLVSYGAGILFADALNTVSLGGFPLGFWFAQQGAIYVFVVLIFVYQRLMNGLDKQFGVEED